LYTLAIKTLDKKPIIKIIITLLRFNMLNIFPNKLGKENLFLKNKQAICKNFFYF